MSKIKSIEAREILDSRGNPTIEVLLETKDEKVKSSVPSGASKGEHEAHELRDGGKRYNGRGVLKAIKNINKVIAPKIIGKSVLGQEKIDKLMIDLDGTENKSKLGANSILGVSLAVCRAGAVSSKKPLYRYINSFFEESKASIPQPCFNIINGGAHAGNDLDFQEFMIVPSKRKIKDNIREASEFYHNLKDKLKKNYSSSAINVGDEGGFAPPLNNAEDALKLISSIKKIDVILDVAAGEFLNEELYRLGIKSLKREDLVNYYFELINKYPIIGLEDPFGENDYEGWKLLSSKNNSKILIIGDDLLATNPNKIKEAYQNGYCNAMILKLNQIGTVSESIESAKLAKKYKWKIIVSHRSGETNDDFIADFSVGINSNYIKSGAPARGERVAKYNRLMEIEEEI